MPKAERPKLLRTQDALRLIGFGWYFATCFIVGLLPGILLDRTWLILVGLLAGSLAGSFGGYRMLKPYLGSSARNDGRRHGGPSQET